MSDYFVTAEDTSKFRRFVNFGYTVYRGTPGATYPEPSPWLVRSACTLWGARWIIRRDRREQERRSVSSSIVLVD
jgi:hypothetical protein